MYVEKKISPRMHLDYTFRHRRPHRTLAEYKKESLTTERNVQTHAKLSRTKEGEERSRLHLHPGVRELKQGSDPHTGASICIEEKHLRLLESAAADL